MTVATQAVYQRERVDALWDEITPLLQQHWEEIAFYDDIPLVPDREAYALMEMAGFLRCYTARIGGSLVGYAAFTVRKALHYATSIQAQYDVVYLDPQHRGGMVGLKLLQYSDAQLQAEGVQVAYHHAKVGHPALAKCLERMGYEAQDVVYGKRLDKE
jgi:L-amino acid N-acyltransferase YncA